MQGCCLDKELAINWILNVHVGMCFTFRFIFQNHVVIILYCIVLLISRELSHEYFLMVLLSKIYFNPALSLSVSSQATLCSMKGCMRAMVAQLKSDSEDLQQVHAAY